MAKEKGYEYHKRNDYPGERVAERKRVAGREKAADKRSDARVAAKGRRDDTLMDSEIQRSTKRATRVNRKRDAADTIGLVVIAGLIVILLAGFIWGFTGMKKQSDKIDYLNSQLDKANSDNYQLSTANRQICGETDTTPPTVLYMSPLTSVSPSNNEMDVPVRVPITIMFSEDMDPLTINKDTFIVEQRTTPQSGSDADQYRSLPIEGVITYNNRKATFTSKDRFHPNQIYGNVFTVTITKGVKDVAGNSLMNDYIWSFTTGSTAFNTGTTTQQTG
ncbi:MAG: Ig-like domain-containing protein [Nanobdellota archaeon]